MSDGYYTVARGSCGTEDGYLWYVVGPTMPDEGYLHREDAERVAADMNWLAELPEPQRKAFQFLQADLGHNPDAYGVAVLDCSDPQEVIEFRTVYGVGDNYATPEEIWEGVLSDYGDTGCQVISSTGQTRF